MLPLGLEKGAPQMLVNIAGPSADATRAPYPMQDLDKLPEHVFKVTVPIDSAFRVADPELDLAATVVPRHRVD